MSRKSWATIARVTADRDAEIHFYRRRAPLSTNQDASHLVFAATEETLVQDGPRGDDPSGDARASGPRVHGVVRGFRPAETAAGAGCSGDAAGREGVEEEAREVVIIGERAELLRYAPSTWEAGDASDALVRIPRCGGGG